MIARLKASARAGGRLFRAMLYALDAAAVVLVTIIAFYVRFEGSVPPAFASAIPWAALAAVVVYLPLFTAFGLYRLVLRYVSVDTMLRVSGAVLIGFVILTVADYFGPVQDGMRLVPLGVLFIQALLVLFTVAGIRVAVRLSLLMRATQANVGRPVLIVGAGSAGSLLLREIQQRPELGLAAIGFLDDDESLHGRTIGGVPVLGTTHNLSASVKTYGANEVLVAMPSAPHEEVRRILNAAANAEVATRIMRSLVTDGRSVSVSDLRPVQVEDLLGRELTPIDVQGVSETIAGKVVAVTGAAGSIGSELCRQVMSLGPRRLMLVEIDETRLYELWLQLSAIDPNVPVMRVCDIRDADRLNEVFAEDRPEVVLHSAAYKHVPVMELALNEALKTNVLGTRNVIRASRECGAERFVLISTDKAVAPVNAMGLSKALAERVMLAESGMGNLLCVAVRFGNVLASRGSVVPIFSEQLSHGGPLTVTHPDVTRYFMTIPEAARLVLQAQAIGASGRHLRARDGRTGQDRRSRTQDDRAVGDSRRHHLHRSAPRREAPRGAGLRARAARADAAREDHEGGVLLGVRDSPGP